MIRDLYVAVVPDTADRVASPWRARIVDEVREDPDKLVAILKKIPLPDRVAIHLAGKIKSDIQDQERLVGTSPLVEITDAGLPTDISISPTGMMTPRVTRSRITLRAFQRQGASIASVSFYVGRAITNRLEPGDRLWMAFGSVLGLSIVRGSDLIVAAGAVTNVRLGRVDARIPTDLVEEATATFRSRDREFEFHEVPVQVCVGRQCCILSSGTREVGPYTVRVEHGFYPGLPGTPECVAIWRTDSGPEVDAIATSWLLDSREVHPGYGRWPPIEVTNW